MGRSARICLRRIFKNSEFHDRQEYHRKLILLKNPHRKTKKTTSRELCRFEVSFDIQFLNERRGHNFRPIPPSLPPSLPYSSSSRSYIHSCINSRRPLALFRLLSCPGRIYDPSLIARIHILASSLSPSFLPLCRGKRREEEEWPASNPCVDSTSELLHKPPPPPPQDGVTDGDGATGNDCAPQICHTF